MSLIKENMDYWQVEKEVATTLMHPRSNSHLETEEIVKTFKNKKLLDWGCGIGRFYPLFKKYDVKYYGVDISKNMIKYFKGEYSEKNLEVIDGFKTSFEEFDIIWCWSVFTHSDDEDVRNILREWKRILKEEGEIYCSVLFGDVEKFSGEVKLISFNKEYFLGIIEEEGFDYEKVLEIKETEGTAQTLFKLKVKK